jgi:hypothetical protein
MKQISAYVVFISIRKVFKGRVGGRKTSPSPQHHPFSQLIRGLLKDDITVLLLLGVSVIANTDKPMFATQKYEKHEHWFFSRFSTV